MRQVQPLRMPLCDGFVLDPGLISTAIVVRPRTKVSPTIVQLRLFRSSGVIALSCPIRSACSGRVLQKGSHNDCNQENAFCSRLVSHSKGSLRVYFFSSGSICTLAGAVAAWTPTEMHLALISNSDRFARMALRSPNRGMSKYPGTFVQL